MIDPNVTWKALERRLETETNLLYRTELETVVRHMKCEIALDIDGVLATLAPNPRYNIFDGAESTHLVLDGVDAIRKEFYEPNFIGKLASEFRVVNLAVDVQCLVTVAISRSVVTGESLQEKGLTVDDPKAAYLRTLHGMAVVWRFVEDGTLLLGEDIYFGSAEPYEKVERSEIAALAL
jgi:hypothetical protein